MEETNTRKWNSKMIPSPITLVLAAISYTIGGGAFSVIGLIFLGVGIIGAISEIKQKKLKTPLMYVFFSLTLIDTIVVFLITSEQFSDYQGNAGALLIISLLMLALAMADHFKNHPKRAKTPSNSKILEEKEFEVRMKELEIKKLRLEQEEMSLKGKVENESTKK